MCAGNDNLHLLTSDKRQRLRVDLADFEGNSVYAEYDNFEVYSEEAQYKLVSLGTYNGTAGQYDERYCHVLCLGNINIVLVLRYSKIFL